MNETNQQQETLKETEAKQGRRGIHTFFIVVASIAGAVVAGWILLEVFS